MLGEVFLCWVYLADDLLDIIEQCEDVLLQFPRTLCWVSFGLNILLFVGYRGDMKIFIVLFATSRVVLVSSRNRDGFLCSRSFVL